MITRHALKLLLVAHSLHLELLGLYAWAKVENDEKRNTVGCEACKYVCSLSQSIALHEGKSRQKS